MPTASLRQQPVDLLDAFFERVRNFPGIPAVETVDGVHSYGELESLAFQLAATVQHLTEERRPRVLIALSRSQRAYAAMLSSLIVGGTFCPVDTKAPEERNAAICAEFAPHVALYENTPPDFLGVLPEITLKIDVLNPLAAGSVSTPIHPSDVAYVAFTSGSTGRPKGVKISRQAFSYFLHVCQSYFSLFPGEKWSQWSSLAHDLGVMDVFMALTQCGTLVPLSEAERLRPATAIRDRRISVWQSVPSVINLMVSAKQLRGDYLASLRLMSFCGAPLRREQLQALFDARPDLVVFNTYGTTETTGFNTLNRLTSENYLDSCGLGTVAIGESVPGWCVQLQNDDVREEAQIIVVSDFLSSGYWQDEEQTQSVFARVNNAGSAGRSCYYTGDRGVRLRGRLYCSGRIDRQVNIHGERIELGEIDSRLYDLGFHIAYTVFCAGELHAFVECAEAVDQERIRALLRNSLSVHAIPRTIHALPSLPLNQSGKIDRDALLRKIES